MIAHDWNDELLDDLRQQMDPPADRVAAAIIEGCQRDAINALMREITHNDASVPDALPAQVHEYFETTAALPAWADPDRILLGEKLFMRYGLQMIQALMFRSLPECYAAADGAQVLLRTKRITGLTHQRVMETLHFIVDVMSPGGLSDEGRGIRSAQRVRLLHASIRAYLLESGRWDPGLGQPINQEDLLGTLSSFSALVIESVERLGAELSEDERDAYMHCWNVVGHVLGIRDELLFHDLADGLALAQRIRERHHRRSEAGVVLMNALLDYADTLVPGEWLDGVNVAMLRLLCGDALADMLEVPAADWTRRLVDQYVRVVDVADDFQDLGRAAAWIGETLGSAFIGAVLGSQRAGSRPDFAIPDGVRQGWGL